MLPQNPCTQGKELKEAKVQMVLCYRDMGQRSPGRPSVEEEGHVACLVSCVEHVSIHTVGLTM